MVLHLSLSDSAPPLMPNYPLKFVLRLRALSVLRYVLNLRISFRSFTNLFLFCRRLCLLLSTLIMLPHPHQPPRHPSPPLVPAPSATMTLHRLSSSNSTLQSNLIPVSVMKRASSILRMPTRIVPSSRAFRTVAFTPIAVASTHAIAIEVTPSMTAVLSSKSSFRPRRLRLTSKMTKLFKPSSKTSPTIKASQTVSKAIREDQLFRMEMGMGAFGSSF